MNRKFLILTGVLVSKSFSSTGQQNLTASDTLRLWNGQVITGQFIAGNSDSIQWKQKGHFQTQGISRNDISGIKFGKNIISLNPGKETGKSNSGDYRLKTVAVLPIEYIANVKESMDHDMPYWLQEMAVTYLGSNSRTLTIIDPAEINAELKKKGISHKELKRYSPAELASLLQVEYVLTGYVMQEEGNKTEVSNYSSSKEIKSVHSNDNARIKVKDQGSSFSSTNQDVKTTVMVKIYDYTGKILFNDTRKSILSTGDAYKKSLQYLLKRTPLYKK